MQTYQRMWQYMSSQVPAVFVTSYAEGIDRVRNQKVGVWTFWNVMHIHGRCLVSYKTGPTGFHSLIRSTHVCNMQNLQAASAVYWFQQQMDG